MKMALLLGSFWLRELMIIEVCLLWRVHQYAQCLWGAWVITMSPASWNLFAMSFLCDNKILCMDQWRNRETQPSGSSQCHSRLKHWWLVYFNSLILLLNPRKCSLLTLEHKFMKGHLHTLDNPKSKRKVYYGRNCPGYLSGGREKRNDEKASWFYMAAG